MLWNLLIVYSKPYVLDNQHKQNEDRKFSDGVRESLQCFDIKHKEEGQREPSIGQPTALLVGLIKTKTYYDLKVVAVAKS